MELGTTLRLNRAFFCLGSIMIVTVIAGAAADAALMRYPGPATRETLHRLSLMRDASIPTWLASILLLACAVALAVSAKVERARAARHVGSWWLLVVIFCLLSLDEVAMVHELSGILLRKLIPASRALGGPFLYSWVLLAIPLIGLLAVMMMRWFLSLPRRVQLQFGTAGVIFLAGAIGMEMYNASLEAAMGENGIEYALSTAIEEALEFAGTLLFLYALLERLDRADLSFTINFSPEHRQASREPCEPRASQATLSTVPE